MACLSVELNVVVRRRWDPPVSTIGTATVWHMDHGEESGGGTPTPAVVRGTTVGIDHSQPSTVFDWMKTGRVCENERDGPGTVQPFTGGEE